MESLFDTQSPRALRLQEMADRPLIYVACPFEHKNPVVMGARALCASYIAMRFQQWGDHAFSPLAYTWALRSLYKAPPGRDSMLDLDKTFLVRCREMRVLHLGGHEFSQGIEEERAYCKEHEIPVGEIRHRDLASGEFDVSGKAVIRFYDLIYDDGLDFWTAARKSELEKHLGRGIARFAR